MRARFVVLCICIMVALTGCATPINADGESIKPNQGLLVLKIESNFNALLSLRDFSTDESFKKALMGDLTGPEGRVFARAGETKFVVIPLEAGDYMWTKLESYPRFAHLPHSNRFTVVPDAITYIGDIKLNAYGVGFSIKVSDGEMEMRNYLSKNYPTYMNTMPMVKVLAELKL